MENKKTPLGLKPEWLHKEQRLQEIREAISRYLEANEAIPVNWIAEEYGLRSWLENRQEEKEELAKASQPVSRSKKMDWEVVAYQTHYLGVSDVIFRKSDRGSFHAVVGNQYTDKFVTCDEPALTHNKAIIHSVKRLSDNSVWSIGDDSNYGKIIGFIIQDEKIRVEYRAIGDWQWLSSLAPKEPIKEVPEDKCVFDTAKINERIEQLKGVEEAFNAGKFFKDYNAYCSWKSAELEKQLKK